MSLDKQVKALRQIKSMASMARQPHMDDDGEFSIFISELSDTVNNFLRSNKDKINNYYTKKERK